MDASQKLWHLSGTLALSKSRAARLAAEIGAKEVSAIWVHYINGNRKLDAHEQENLKQLLKDAERASASDDDSALHRELVSVVENGSSAEAEDTIVYYVSPRPGTISPWSSQTTAIAHVNGLKPAIKRVERGVAIAIRGLANDQEDGWQHKLFDRMTQTINNEPPSLDAMFGEHERSPLTVVPLLVESGPSREILEKTNRELGLALDKSEIDYLMDAYGNKLKRNPTDVELFMFAQVNSEHCRHKQFNADWTIDGMGKPNTLFGMIRNTHKEHPEYTVSAYSDNAAVFEGVNATHWSPNYQTGVWTSIKEQVHILGKVETHNHPTAVSPFPGAATGSGGEIRDEGAVGQGSKPKAGLSGFCVSDLLIPDFEQPWENHVGKPNHIASSLDIMLEAPIGSAAFNNEFGRPAITGFFRTLSMDVPIGKTKSECRGYHKPIMLAGGVGTVRPQHAIKPEGLVKPGAYLIVLGGPAMLIGLGGGAASSVQSGEGSVELDFASVQRGNPEVQRRAQEVINTCTGLGEKNPILLIHDVGAGGLSNALPEIVHDAGLGATFELREVDNADNGMSPLQIWCCEAQERYVLAVGEEGLESFIRIAKRERCGYSIVGRATGDVDGQGKRLILKDRDSKEHPTPIDLPMSILFGKPPKLSRIVESRRLDLPAFEPTLSKYMTTPCVDLFGEAVNRVLSLPSVGSKSFLITIGDRTVGGLTVRDQMVGPWQVPVADVAVTATSLSAGIKTGEAMAMGEKPTLALVSPAASARMAVAEALMNMAAADLMDRLDRVRLSANWMAASGHPGEAAALYEAVEAIGMELCPQLGISIPVGKDSMSMKMKWKDAEKQEKEVTAPLSLVITGFGVVRSLASTWTPALRRFEDVGETLLLFVDLAEGMKALGGSAVAQCFGQVGNEVPDIRDVELFKDFFDAIEQLHEAGIVLAYHDRSDGGLLTTLIEMMFAGRCGLEVMLDKVVDSTRTEDLIRGLFNEELGAVFQVRKKDEIAFQRCFATCGPPSGLIKRIGRVPTADKQSLTLLHGTSHVYTRTRASLQQTWSATSHQLQRRRDEPSCADAEFAAIADDTDPGLSCTLSFNPKDSIMPWTSTLAAALPLAQKPRVAILREQGVNGQAEMAFAFDSAGFSAVDVHMTDIITGRVSLASFVGLAACGGFSYGDVLGAGQGWAKSVLLNPAVRADFAAFFARPDTFTLGVCNGCQFLTRLAHIIPGCEAGNVWPTFERNVSEQYEARVCMLGVDETGPLAGGAAQNRASLPPSVFLHGMSGSTLPIVTAHGEGRAVFPASTSAAALVAAGLAPLRYLDNHRLAPTERYPANPNGSPEGVAAVRSPDGRVLAMMPHPERSILGEVAGSWDVQGRADREGWGELGPWIRLFKSARRWVG